MAISVSYNGVVYSIPETGEESWGENVTTFLVAIPAGCLQKSGGSFTLTADVNFGANFGLLSKYFSTRTALPSTAGLVRLAVTDSIGWKNNAGGGNLLLAVNGSDQLTFNGTAIASVISIGALDAQAENATGLALVANVLSAQSADATHPGLVNITTQSFAGQKTFSTGLTGTLTGAASLNVLTSALGNLTDAGTDGITVTGGTGSVVGSVSLSQRVSDASHNGYLSSADWSTFNGKTSGGITALTGDVTASGPGSVAATIGANKVTTAMMATISTQTFLGRTTASTGNVEDLTATQATAILNAMVGDSGSGGTKGLVPAPASGDAAAAKFLKADGTWAAPAGVGTVTSVAMTVPTFLSIAGSPVTSAGTLAVSLSGTALPVLNGGTGVTTSTGSGNNVLSTSPTLVTPILGTPTSGVLTNCTGLTASGVSTATFTAPTSQIFTSSSGTYTTPTSPRTPLYLELEMVGGGGGGGGSGGSGSPGNGGAGGNTTFSTYTAGGGGGGALGSGATGSGAGGAPGSNSGSPQVSIVGAAGQSSIYTAAALATESGGQGGSGYFGGAGAGGSAPSISSTGGAGATNSGGGGGGAGGDSTATHGGGGGASGNYVKQIITSPAATYSYSVGAAGTAGSAGATGGGGAGGSGLIRVVEYYQ